jgi:hypothetical protein
MLYSHCRSSDVASYIDRLYRRRSRFFSWLCVDVERIHNREESLKLSPPPLSCQPIQKAFTFPSLSSFILFCDSCWEKLMKYFRSPISLPWLKSSLLQCFTYILPPNLLALHPRLRRTSIFFFSLFLLINEDLYGRVRRGLFLFPLILFCLPTVIILDV